MSRRRATPIAASASEPDLTHRVFIVYMLRLKLVAMYMCSMTILTHTVLLAKHMSVPCLRKSLQRCGGAMQATYRSVNVFQKVVVQ